MDDASIRMALWVARAAEHRGCLEPGDWPDVAVCILLEGNEDPEIAELAGLSRQVNGWDTDPLVAAVCERHGVSIPDADESTDLVARLMADDLRARPAAVTAPMIRLLARLAPPDFTSDLANRCFGMEEYLDCGCAEVDIERRKAAMISAVRACKTKTSLFSLPMRAVAGRGYSPRVPKYLRAVGCTHMPMSGGFTPPVGFDRSTDSTHLPLRQDRPPRPPC